MCKRTSIVIFLVDLKYSFNIGPNTDLCLWRISAWCLFRALNSSIDQWTNMFYKSWHFFPVTVWNYLNILLGYSCWHFMLSNSFLNEVRATHISSLTDVWYLQTEMSCVTEELKPILKFLQARLLCFPIIQFAWKVHRIPASNKPGATPMILLPWLLITMYMDIIHYIWGRNIFQRNFSEIATLYLANNVE